jgi:predicted RNA-binding protein with PIN domain
MDLPVEVRVRVVALASARLGALKPERVPASLKAVARFTPAKRAKLGSGPLLAALESDPGFRQAVAEEARVWTGHGSADQAAVAYLLRTPGWEGLVSQVAAEAAARSEQAAGSVHVDAVARLTEQLVTVRATGRLELEKARTEARETSAELAAVRRKVRELGDRISRAENAQRVAEAALGVALAEVARLEGAREAALRQLTDQLAESERALTQARQVVREGRQDDQLRLRLLLDSVVEAAQGLRRKLALPPSEARPADALDADYPVPAGGPSLQGRSADDPTLLDALLGVPRTHLLVDGYNVTKTGYPGVSLEAQRLRLVAGLKALQARTSVEVTVVFDGADGVGAAAGEPLTSRQVRVLFSRTGETADEVIRRYVRNEPVGRSVVVVSSDKEIIEGVVRSGARAVAARALTRLLER